MLTGCYLGAAWMLPGCYLGATWMLPGCYLGATWMLPAYYLGATWALPGCYLGATWVLPGCYLDEFLGGYMQVHEGQSHAGAVQRSKWGHRPPIGASNTPVARYGRRVRVHTPWENIKVVCFLSRATSIRKAPPHLGLLPSPHAGYFKKPPPLIQEHAFY